MTIFSLGLHFDACLPTSFLQDPWDHCGYYYKVHLHLAYSPIMQ